MTENEAKDVLDRFWEFAICREEERVDILKNIIEAANIAIQALEEKQQYESIGTIEELKILKEKSVTKKPKFYAHNYYCAECDNLVGFSEFGWQRFLYCDKCGQKLDWQ